MRHLCLILGVAACGGGIGSPEETTPPRPTVEELRAPPAPPPAPPPTPPPAAEGPPPAAPFWQAKAHVEGTQRWDEFTFLGWSEDDRRYAFTWWWPGPGGATCEGEAGIGIVDAATDEFVTDGYFTARHRDPEPITGKCDPPDLRAAIADREAGFLARHGIESGRMGTTSEVRRSADGRTVLSMPDGREAEVRAEAVGGGRDVIFAHGGREGAALRLVLRGLAGVDLVLDDGRMRRPAVWGYTPVRAFWSPGGTHGALITERLTITFEGDRHAFGTDGFRIPKP